MVPIDLNYIKALKIWNEVIYLSPFQDVNIKNYDKYKLFLDKFSKNYIDTLESINKTPVLFRSYNWKKDRIILCNLIFIISMERVRYYNLFVNNTIFKL